MTRFEINEFIRSPAEAVFDYFSDPANLPKWQVNTEHAEWVTSGAPGLGSKFKVISSFGGEPLIALLQVTLWDRPNRYAFRSIDTPFPLKRLEGFTTLTPRDGGTHLAFKGQIALSALFKVGESLIRKQYLKQDGGNIILMKQALEAGYPPPGISSRISVGI